MQEAADKAEREWRAEETREEPITRKQLVDAITQCRNECSTHAAWEFQALSERITQLHSRVRDLERAVMPGQEPSQHVPGMGLGPGHIPRT